MTAQTAYLLVFAGLAMLLSGCSNPLGVAAKTANAAAVSLKATHGALLSQRKAQQLAAAARVKGDRSDPIVKKEQLDRALQVGVKYREAWAAYTVAYHAWVAAVALIKAATLVADAGGVPRIDEITKAVMVLVGSLDDFYNAAHKAGATFANAPPRPSYAGERTIFDER